MEPTQLPPNPNPNPDADLFADDHLLEDLASLTGLFNPELIWKKEEQLDDLNEPPETTDDEARENT